ncbi:AAC-rich mRNA clone AAC4 protein-like [Haliotis cracherodii]|uniref:AAC-rich mRNA clone AAC4 protein-like n=1 Tax=Haliotis cracherodii TaxID=6455 RepID=UPI0039E7D59C
MSLTEGAERIRDVPNAGGNSVLSEVLSFELMNKCFAAKLLKTEMEVSYFPCGGSITDYVCEVFGQRLGVSVTRAMKYKGDYSEEDALHLLCKKLKGIVQSSRNTLENWSKQILHVWATNKHVARVVERAYELVPVDLRGNTMVLVTTATESKFIFLNAC